MDLNEFFQGLRVVTHILTILILAAYCPGPGANKRFGLSVWATIVVASSACICASTLLNWDQWLVIPLAGHMCLALIFGALLFPVIAGRGNVASLFPRKVWSDRP